MHWILPVIALLMIVPSAAAAPENANIIDPVGDAGPNQQAVPAGVEWADLVAVWFDGETETEIIAHIEVAAAPQTTPVGEIAIRLTVGEGHFIVGWTNIAFPAPPFVYSGGFICLADVDYVAEPANCDSLAGVTLENNVYTLPLSRETLGANKSGGVIERIDAYTEIWLDNNVKVPFDATVQGVPYVFRTGASEAPVEGVHAEPDTTKAENLMKDQAPADANEDVRVPAEEAPGVPVAWLVVLATFLAMRRQR